MPQPGSFSIAFAPDVSSADRETLLLVIRARADEVQEAPAKALDWLAFVAIMGDVGKVAGGASALIVLGKQLFAAVQALRKRGTPPRAQLARPGQPPLDLATATEQELLDWLLHSPPAQP